MPIALIVDDERCVRQGLKNLLEGEGYEVAQARDGEEALAKIAERRPDVVLLDVMMPKMNGFRCCETIRQTDRTLPVVFLTAKDAEADQVRGIGCGADDFVSKQAGDAVLLARIGRAIDRARLLLEKAEESESDVIRIGDVSVGRKDLVVRRRGEEIARLTRTEGDLLGFLNRHRGEFFVTDDLITELRGNGFACEDTMLYMHVLRLKRKLGPAAGAIVHRRGFGYALFA